ncbi:hypothetical protein MYX82_13525, partial [Acidobacteria bacterium AH-259-D05]|nr:hypothetical protein [Acidobacteria bacterium AH-259-D05]
LCIIRARTAGAQQVKGISFSGKGGGLGRVARAKRVDIGRGQRSRPGAGTGTTGRQAAVEILADCSRSCDGGTPGSGRPYDMMPIGQVTPGSWGQDQSLYCCSHVTRLEILSDQHLHSMQVIPICLESLVGLIISGQTLHTELRVLEIQGDTT